MKRRFARVQNAERLDSEIIYNRDFDYDYFGFKVGPACLAAAACKADCQPCKVCSCNGLRVVSQTLERSYLLRINGAVVERPQHMLMRVAVGIHKEVGPGLHGNSACLAGNNRNHFPFSAEGTGQDGG